MAVTVPWLQRLPQRAGRFDADASRGRHRALWIVRIEPDIEANESRFREAEADILQGGDRDRVLQHPELRETLVASDQLGFVFFEQPQANRILVEVLPADFIADLYDQVTRGDLRPDVDIPDRAGKVGAALVAAADLQADCEQREQDEDGAYHARSYKKSPHGAN